PRLLVLDRFVDDDEPTILPALWDLHLLMTTGGGHRSLSRGTNVGRRAGFDAAQIKAPPMETTALIGTPSEPPSTRKSTTRAQSGLDRPLTSSTRLRISCARCPRKRRSPRGTTDIGNDDEDRRQVFGCGARRADLRARSG